MSATTAEIAEEVKASTMKLVGPVAIQSIHDAGSRELNAGDIDEDHTTLMVEVSVSYTGDLPESLRVINALVLDWVSANILDIEEAIRAPLTEYLEEEYPEVDYSEMLDDEAELVWTDQVDYLVSVDEEEKEVHFSIEINQDIESL